MKYLSLFSGIESASAAWEPLGWECVGVSEILSHQNQFLKSKYPSVPNLGDVTKITEEDVLKLGKIDIVVFGSPCQGLSIAGNRGGFNNEASSTSTNSTLFFAGMQIARYSKARFILWENVPGALTCTLGKDFARVVAEMAGIDNVEAPCTGWGTEGAALGNNGLLEWSVLNAAFFGVAQRRRRLFALLDTGDWRSRKPVLLESEGERGNTTSCKSKRQDYSKEIRECPSFGIPGNWIGRSPKNGGNATTPMFDIAPNLTRTDHHAVVYYDNNNIPHVRKFTVKECLRLQGFSDDYLDCMNASDDKKIEIIGRSMAVPVMNWIGRRLSSVI